MSLRIQRGAMFIADAHYSASHRPQLKTLFQEIQSGKYTPPQLVLMGDIFDTLFAPVDFSIQENSDMIELLEKIAEKIEVIYLEGNHDFCLAELFKNIQVFPLASQPIRCDFEGKTLYLAHGDFGERLRYKIYTSLIRSKGVLLLLKYIDIISGHLIRKKLAEYLNKKEDCTKFENFQEYVHQRLAKSYIGKCDLFIEGHFHQDVVFSFGKTEYRNLPAFACNQRYFIVT
jgi:UDP-2,3-diacylglucosamine hydrolase